MITLGFAAVLLVHSVAVGGLSDAHAPHIVGRTLNYPTVQVAHGWRYPHAYGGRADPSYPPVYAGYACAPHDDDREGPWRLVSLSLSAGLAHASGADIASNEPSGAFGARLGAGLIDRLSLTVGLEGTRGRRGELDESETAALLGLQWYLFPFLYIRGAAGAGVVRYASPGGAYYAGDSNHVLHPVVSAALGLELSDSAGFALGVEGVSTWMHLPGENWSAVQANLVVSFF